MSDLMNRLSLSAAHAKSNDRQPAAQMLLEAIDAIDARDVDHRHGPGELSGRAAHVESRVSATRHDESAVSR